MLFGIEAAVHEVDGLDGPFDEFSFSEKVDQPKALAFGLYSGHIFLVPLWPAK
jgi:hypothetical protein